MNLVSVMINADTQHTLKIHDSVSTSFFFFLRVSRTQRTLQQVTLLTIRPVTNNVAKDFGLKMHAMKTVLYEFHRFWSLVSAIVDFQ